MESEAPATHFHYPRPLSPSCTKITTWFHLACEWPLDIDCRGNTAARKLVYKTATAANNRSAILNRKLRRTSVYIRLQTKIIKSNRPARSVIKACAGPDPIKHRADTGTVIIPKEHVFRNNFWYYVCLRDWFPLWSILDSGVILCE